MKDFNIKCMLKCKRNLNNNKVFYKLLSICLFVPSDFRNVWANFYETLTVK